VTTSKIFKAFNKVIDQVGLKERYGISVSKKQVQTFLRVLDLDDSGVLEAEEIFNVITARGNFGL